MTVWAVHPIKYDVSAANRFGKINYINRGYVFGDELIVDAELGLAAGVEDEGVCIMWTLPGKCLINMRRCVDDFKPGVDFLLIIGDHLQLMQLTAMLLIKHPYIDVLRYDRKVSDYIPVRLHSTLCPT